MRDRPRWPPAHDAGKREPPGPGTPWRRARPSRRQISPPRLRLVVERVEAQGVEEPVEGGGDLASDVVPMAGIEAGDLELDVAGRNVRRLPDPTAERTHKRTGEEHADDEREQDAHDERQARVRGRVVR